MARAKASKKTRKLRITLVRSPIGFHWRQKRTVRALGLRRLNHSVERENNPAVLGMIARVSHLVRVEERSEHETS